VVSFYLEEKEEYNQSGLFGILPYLSITCFLHLESLADCYFKHKSLLSKVVFSE